MCPLRRGRLGRVSLLILFFLAILLRVLLSHHLLIFLMLTSDIGVTRLASEIETSAINVKFCATGRLRCCCWKFCGRREVTGVSMACYSTIRHIVYPKMLWRHVKLTLISKGRMVILLYLVVCLQIFLQLPSDMMIDKI